MMSWEIKQQNAVFGAFLHTDLVSVAWALGLRNIILPGTFHPVCGMPYDHARNECVKAMLASQAEWLFFLDSDVIPPRDVVLRLMAHRLPMVSGVYYRRSPPHGVPVMMKGGQWFTNLPERGLVEVDLVGAGCLLLHRHFLERIPPQRPGSHWFDWRVNLKNTPGMADHQCLSEDFTLNVWAKQHGIPTMVDASVRCRHVGLAEAGPGSLLPVNTTPHT